MMIMSNIRQMQSIDQKLINTTKFAVQSADLKTAVDDYQLFIYFGEALVFHPCSQKITPFEVIILGRCFYFVAQTLLIIVLVWFFKGFLPIFRSEMNKYSRLNGFDWFIGCHSDADRFLIINRYDLYSYWQLIILELNEFSLVKLGSKLQLANSIFLKSVFLMILNGSVKSFKIVFLHYNMSKSRQISLSHFEADSKISQKVLGRIYSISLRFAQAIRRISFKSILHGNFNMISIGVILQLMEKALSFIYLRILIVIVDVTKINDSCYLLQLILFQFNKECLEAMDNTHDLCFKLLRIYNINRLYFRILLLVFIFIRLTTVFFKYLQNLDDFEILYFELFVYIFVFEIYIEVHGLTGHNGTNANPKSPEVDMIDKNKRFFSQKSNLKYFQDGFSLGKDHQFSIIADKKIVNQQLSNKLITAKSFQFAFIRQHIIEIYYIENLHQSLFSNNLIKYLSSFFTTELKMPQKLKDFVIGQSYLSQS